MENLQTQINDLKEKISKLEGQFSDYDKTEGLKDRFFENTNASAEQTVALSGNPQNIEVPVSSGTLTLVYKGTRYKLLYE